SLTSIMRLTFQFNFIPLWWLFHLCFQFCGLYFNPASFIHGKSFIFSLNFMACISIRLHSFTAAPSSLTSIVRLIFQFNFISLWWLFHLCFQFCGLYFNPASFIHGKSFIFSLNFMACISIRLHSFTAASSSLTSIVRLTFQFNFIPLWWLFHLCFQFCGLYFNPASFIHGRSFIFSLNFMTC